MTAGPVALGLVLAAALADTSAHLGLGRTYSAQGRYPEAVAELKLAIAEEP